MARSVVVVEDERQLCALLADLLVDAGYEVRCAADGLEAWAEVEERLPDLVVSDVAMPRLGGLALAARLRARGVPVILLSAGYRPAGLSGVPFVAKPFDLDHLLGVVERTLARPEVEAERHAATTSRAEALPVPPAPKPIVR